MAAAEWNHHNGCRNLPLLVGNDDTSDGGDDRIFDSLFGGMCSPCVDGRCRPDDDVGVVGDQAGND